MYNLTFVITGRGAPPSARVSAPDPEAPTVASAPPREAPPVPSPRHTGYTYIYMHEKAAMRSLREPSERARRGNRMDLVRSGAGITAFFYLYQKGLLVACIYIPTRIHRARTAKQRIHVCPIIPPGRVILYDGRDRKSKCAHVLMPYIYFFF